MKKYLPIFVVVVLVLSIIGVAWGNPVWASPRANSVANAPLKTLINISANGTSNVGGVCDVTANFKTGGANTKIAADAEVPVDQSKVVPYNFDVDVFGHLLYPGCHFVFYDKDGKVIDQLNTSTDNPLKVCFGASPQLTMNIFYYIDTPATGRVWTQLPAHLEDNGRLVCTDALITGVYMPTGFIPPSQTYNPGENAMFPDGLGGTVLPPPNEVNISASGTYAVGGICLVKTDYYTTGLSDIIRVEYPKDQKVEYSQDTKTIPFADFTAGNGFFFPGCHIIHFKDLQIQDQVNQAQVKDGLWQICFAAIPGKTMKIYYYDDNLTNIVAPWNPLETTTENGMACATIADFSAVYVPTGK
jgi:hypothetical protein